MHSCIVHMLVDHVKLQADSKRPSSALALLVRQEEKIRTNEITSDPQSLVQHVHSTVDL